MDQGAAPKARAGDARGLAVTDLLSHALTLAEQGFYVFPVGADKKPLAGSHGWQDGTTDASKIEGMSWPLAAGVAIATGPSGLLVLDEDPGGEKELARLEQEHGPLPPTRTVKTPRGRHGYYRVSSLVPSSASKVAPGLDIRAQGGYVVADGSRNAEGVEYRLVVDEPIAPCPGWLVALALNGSGKKSTPSNGSAPDGEIPLGQLHSLFLSHAGAMRRRGMSAEAIEAALLAENRARCSQPEDEAEIRKLARDVAMRYAPATSGGASPASPADVLTDPSNPKHQYQPISHVKELAAEIAKQKRISLGIPALDKLLNGGALPRQCVVVGAFTTNGKSTFAINQTNSHAKAGRPVLLVNAEVANGEAYRKLEANDPECHKLPISMYDESREIAVVVAVIGRFLDDHDSTEETPVVIVDFLQNLRAPTQHSREREVATCVEMLQELARKRGFLLILAAQLNRESTKDERPSLRHFRESGTIEQAADIALLLQKIDETQLWIQVAKQRWGRAPEEVTLWCDFERCTLKDCDTKQLYKSLADDVADYLRKHRGKSTVRALCRSIWWRGKRPTKKDIQETEKLFNLWAIEGRNVALADPVDTSAIDTPTGNGILSFDPAALKRTPEEEKALADREAYEKASGIDFGA